MIWKIIGNKEWDNLEKEFLWLTDVKKLSRDQIDEENVVLDTQVMLNELIKLPQYKELSDQDKEILWAATLLLNIENLSASQEYGYANISVNGHARRKERAVRSILYRDIPTPFHIRETITALVRYHGLPLWIMEKLEPAKKIHGISLRVDTRFLKILAEADARSRKGKDIQSLLDSLALFEQFCKDEGCWGKPMDFDSSNARFEYFNTIDGYIGHISTDDFKSEVTMLVGLPGMGKNAYSKSLKASIPVISLDEIRRKHKYNIADKIAIGKVVQEAKKQAREYLREGQSFVWNAANITSLKRHQLVDFFTLYGAKVSIIYLEKPYSKWREQNRETDQPFPDEVLDKMMERLEIPQLVEGHKVEYVVSE